MTRAQLEEYDLFLDENDWDLYYWATQSPANTPTTLETAEGMVDNTTSQTDAAYQSPAVPGQAQETDAWRQGGEFNHSDSTFSEKDGLTCCAVAPKSGEWSQTVGRSKVAYRPVPTRWKNSEILTKLREHVRSRSAGGVLDDVNVTAKGSGMGRMPALGQPFSS